MVVAQMECNRISELLPWQVNGTLPAPERTLVSEHLAGCAKCKQLLNETKFMLSAGQTHVPIEVLLDYAEGQKLKNFDPVLFENHLAVCDECSEQLKLVSGSFDSIDTDEPILTQKNNVVSLNEKREKREVVAAPVAVPNPFWKYAAIAACVLLTLSLGGLLYSLHEMKNSQSQLLVHEHTLRERINTLETESKQKNDRFTHAQEESKREIEDLKTKVAETKGKLEQKERESERQTQTSSKPGSPTPTQPNNSGQPQANVVVLDVFPSSVSRSEEANENALIVPRNAQSVTMILNYQSNVGFESYAIELRSANGRLIWQSNNMRRYSTNDFTINLPTTLLRNGVYSINIFGFQKMQKTKLENYTIRVTKS